MFRNVLIQLKIYKRCVIASKEAIQKTAEETGDLTGNKIADKITSISKKPVKELPINDEDAEITTRKKKIYMTRRKTTNYWWIKVST